MDMTADVALTPADWRRRLSQPCPEASSVQADRVARDFRAITQRVRRLSQSPRLALQESLALQPHWRRTLELLQLLTEYQAAAVVPPDVIELLRTIDQGLQLLESHLALCEFTLATAERLHPIVEDIVHGIETSSRRLLNVASELTATLDEGDVRPCLAPVPLFATAAALEQAGWARADWFTQGILCARLTAAVSPRLGFERDTGGWLIAAALVQDIGAWHQPYRDRHQTALQQGRRRADPNHPATGAAILHGVNDAAVLLSLLVGTHHERIDGTGFPQRLSGSRLAPEQQCLGLLVRLAELLTDPLTGQLAVEQDEPLETAAGLRLWREVRRGSFAEPLTRIVLETLRPGLADEVDALYPTRVRRLVDVAHPVPAPLGETAKPPIDAAESAVNPPAFLRRRHRGGSLSRAIRHGRDW
jgi:hypothetical protein